MKVVNLVHFRTPFPDRGQKPSESRAERRIDSKSREDRKVWELFWKELERIRKGGVRNYYRSERENDAM